MFTYPLGEVLIESDSAIAVKLLNERCYIYIYIYEFTNINLLKIRRSI